MTELLIPEQAGKARAEHARRFCSEFTGDKSRPRYVFGRNVYATDILDHVDVDGIIDDFTEETFFHDKPVVKTEQVPSDSLILIASGGRPTTIKHQLDRLGLQNLDYFAFRKWSGLPLMEAVCNEGFEEEFNLNRDKYDWIFGRLADEESRAILSKLVSFRLRYDLGLIEDFEDRQREQYFEPFLELQPAGESFIDIGGFDGNTSIEFARICPDYSEIHLFEPELDNYEICQQRLANMRDTHFYNTGLSDRRATVRFDKSGSGSRISEDGESSIEVDRLDDVVNGPATFIKIDIEGAELDALAGARDSIMRHHPKLAICVYHNVGDFWRIPEYVLAMRDDYRIYIRHYTETIYETVMYFVPVNEG
jgi:FkbM family methyltransferase